MSLKNNYNFKKNFHNWISHIVVILHRPRANLERIH